MESFYRFRPYLPLGRLVEEASPIVVLEVTKVDRKNDLIIYKPAVVLKGKVERGLVRHYVYFSGQLGPARQKGGLLFLRRESRHVHR